MTEQIYKNRVIKISDKQIIKRLNYKIKKISLSKQNYLQNQKIHGLIIIPVLARIITPILEVRM